MYRIKYYSSCSWILTFIYLNLRETYEYFDQPLVYNRSKIKQYNHTAKTEQVCAMPDSSEQLSVLWQMGLTIHTALSNSRLQNDNYFRSFRQLHVKMAYSLWQSLQTDWTTFRSTCSLLTFRVYSCILILTIGLYMPYLLYIHTFFVRPQPKLRWK